MRGIGKTQNYYGGLWIKEENGNYYWNIENYDGIENDDDWELIPKYLYKALIKFDDDPHF